MSMKKILVEINGSDENQLDFFKKNFNFFKKFTKFQEHEFVEIL